MLNQEGSWLQYLYCCTVGSFFIGKKAKHGMLHYDNITVKMVF